MAVKPKEAAPAAKAPPKPAAPQGPTGLAGSGPWLGPIYVASFLLLFVGERLLGEAGGPRYFLSGIGAIGAASATALRFMLAAQQKDAEKKRIERALALFSALGVVGLAVYFTTTDTGKTWLGIATAAPDTRARIEGLCTVLWIVLVVVSLVPLLFGEIALAPMRRAPRMEGRRVRAATVAGMTLAFAAVYTALFTYAAGELDVKADYSYFRTAKAGEATKKIVSSTPDTVEVRAFFPPLNDVGIEVEGYLKEIAHDAPNFKYGFYDRLLYPQLAKDNKVSQDGVLVVLRGASREQLSLGTDMKSAAAKLKTLDADFQKSLLKAMREQRTAYFTVGHGEIAEGGGAAGGPPGRNAKALRRLLESQNYVVKDLGPAQGLANEVPRDASIVVILGPTQAFLPEEVTALQRYADGGGKLFIALDPEAKVDVSPLANLADLTFKSGQLAAGDRFFVPRRRNSSDKANLVTNRFSSHASVSTLSRNSARAAVFLSGVGTLDKKDGTDAKVDFVVRSTSEAFVDDNGNYELDPGEKKSSYNIAAAVTKPVKGADASKDDKKGPAEMRAFVLADADGLSDAWMVGMTDGALLETNAVLFLDAMRWLGGEESFSGEIATAEDVRIEHTKQKDVLWFYGTIFAAPLALLGCGVWVTRRARSRTSGRRA